MIMMISFSALISLTIIFLNIFLSNKQKKMYEKLSSFECGFNSMNQFHRTPFSIRFFIITLVFLIFDIEIVYIIPIIMNKNFSIMTIMSQVFILMLIIYSLFHEWVFGNIDWM